jgi:hypothetical protein
LLPLDIIAFHSWRNIGGIRFKLVDFMGESLGLRAVLRIVARLITVEASGGVLGRRSRSDRRNKRSSCGT